MASGDSAYERQEVTDAARFAKRAVYRVGAMLVLAFGGFAFLYRNNAVPVFFVHALWAAHIFLVGELVGRRVIAVNRGGVVSSMGGVLCLPAILLLAGPLTENIMFPALIAMPLIIAALAPDDRASVGVFSAGSIGWSLVLDVTAMQPAGRIAADIAVAVACSVIALVATFHHERARRAEHHIAGERLSALARLAAIERERLASERLVVIGKMSAGVAHEINNPLTFVFANTVFLREQLEAKGELDTELDQLLSEIDVGMRRIQQIVLDLGKFSREDSGQEPRFASPFDAVGEALRIVAVRARMFAVVDNRVPSDAPAVAMAHGRLVQVVVNLLVNAIDALEGMGGTGHRIGISAAVSSPDSLEIVVEDSGPGLPQHVLAHLFDPFFTTKAPGLGTGLGLALCREYVDAVGGRISAENHEAGGARFVVRLPVLRRAIEAQRLAS